MTTPQLAARSRCPANAVAACLFALVAATWFWGTRDDLRYLSLVERLGPPALLVGWALLGIAALARRRGRLLAGWFIVAALLALAVATNSRGLRAAPFADLRCLPLGLLVGGGVLALLLALYRDQGAPPDAPVASCGAVAGAAGGLIGAAFLHLHCPLAGPAHLLTSHLSPLLLLAVAGAALRARRDPPTG